MAKNDVNPLEELTEQLADDYADYVEELTEMFAPVRPWWSTELSQDAQLWRYMTGGRAQIVAWLTAAGVYMGWKTWEETLQKLDQIFTSPAAPDLIPPDVVIDMPPELLEMVQSAGPAETASHIRKMEKLVEGQQAAAALLASTNQPNFPEPPIQPAAMPVELVPGTAGWPNFGMVPQEMGSKFGPGDVANLAGR